MNAAQLIGFLAAVGIVLVMLLLNSRGALPWTCDPPRHMVAVETIDGFGHHECVYGPVPASPTPSASR